MTSALRRKYLHITALRLIYLSSAFWRNYMAIREMGNNFRHDALVSRPRIILTSALRRKYLHITALRLIYLSSAFWRNYMAIREMGNNFRHDALVSEKSKFLRNGEFKPYRKHYKY